MAKRGKFSEMTAVGYARRSTDRQEQSIPDQKMAIEKYAKDNGLEVIKVYVDDAISGTSALGRKSFQQMISDAESPRCRFSKIIVYDMKRFGRVDNDEAGFYRHRLKTSGVEVIYVTENFNGDYTDDLLRPVKQWQARQESKDLSKVTIRGLVSKAEQGWWMGGVPPYGYDLRYENSDGQFLFTVRYLPDKTKQVLDEQGDQVRTLGRDESIQVTKKDRAKLLSSCNKRVKVIKDIFEMYANLGKGYKSIAATLNTRKVEPARNKKWASMYSGRWNNTTIKAIIDNPLYAGDMVWNRRTDARFHKISGGRAVDRKDIHGARLVPNAEKDWIIVRDTHQPLIPRRLFDKARNRKLNKPASIEQRGIDPRSKTHGKTWDGKRSRFILSGLITCQRCGSRYQGCTRSKGKVNNDGTRSKQHYYGCGGYITKGKAVCQIGSIAQEVLESAVIEKVLDYYSKYLEPNDRDMLAKIVKEHTQSETIDYKQAKQRAADELDRVDEIITNLLDNLTETNREFVDKRLNELKEQKQKLETRLQELDRLETSQQEIQDTISETMRFITSLEYTLRKGLPQEKLVCLRQCIDRIWINDSENNIKLDLFVIPASSLKAKEQTETQSNTQSFSVIHNDALR